MTITFRPDPKHTSVTKHVCPRCGARRNEFLPCGECGEERTWQQAHHEAIASGHAAEAVNALLAGVAGVAGAKKGSESATFKGGDAA